MRLAILGRKVGLSPVAVAVLFSIAACAKYPTPFVSTNPGSNWWMYQADLAHTGHYRGSGITVPLQVAWERELVSSDLARRYMQPPVFGNGKVFAFHGLNPGTLHALSTQDGSTIWSFTVPSEVGIARVSLVGAPTVANGLVYGGYGVTPTEGRHTGRLYALREDNGTVAWVTELPSPPVGSVAVANGLVFAFLFPLFNVPITPEQTGSVLYAVDQESGAMRWTAYLGSSYSSTFVSPAVGFGYIFVADKDAVYAVRTNGTLAWEFRFPVQLALRPYIVIHTETEVGERSLVLVAGTLPGPQDDSLSAVVFALSPSGSLVWSFGILERESYGLAAATRKVFLVTRRHITALSAPSGAQIWTHQAPGDLWFPPAISGGVLYYHDGDNIYGLNAEDGSQVWSGALPGALGLNAHGIAIDQGLVIAPNYSFVTAFSPSP